MSYHAAYAAYAKAPYALPVGFTGFLAAWAAILTQHNTPEPGTREISVEEWSATPPEYLVHPSLHPKLFSRVPIEATVEDKRAALFKKAGHADHSPPAPVGGHH